MQVLKPKGRPGGLETWAPLGFSYEPIEKGNLLFPGAAPSAPVETQEKSRPCLVGREKPPHLIWEAGFSKRSSSSGRTLSGCHVSDSASLRKHHSDRLAGPLTLFHAPPWRLQLTLYKLADSIPQLPGFVKPLFSLCERIFF